MKSRNTRGLFRGPWLLPVSVLLVLVFIFSLRLLADAREDYGRALEIDTAYPLARQGLNRTRQSTE